MAAKENQEIEQNDVLDLDTEPSTAVSDGESDEINETAQQQPEPQGFEPRFTQFQASDIYEYKKQLEDAYASSSTEGQRLNEALTQKEQEFEVLRKIVGSNPQIKEAMSSAMYQEGYDDPFEEGVTAAGVAQVVEQVLDKKLPELLGSNPALKSIEADKEAETKQIFDKFVEEHPQLRGNPELAEKFDFAFRFQSTKSAERKEPIDLRTILNRAWTTVQGENMQNSNQQDERTPEEAELDGMSKMANKQQASMSSPSTSGTSKPGGTKRQLTPIEQAVAREMGLTDEEYAEGKDLATE